MEQLRDVHWDCPACEQARYEKDIPKTSPKGLVALPFFFFFFSLFNKKEKQIKF
jgi:hypothetical protein